MNLSHHQRNELNSDFPLSFYQEFYIKKNKKKITLTQFLLTSHRGKILINININLVK